ncbi:MAG TPA: hypothetical protein VF328_10025 [Mycobacterium sp.]
MSASQAPRWLTGWPRGHRPFLVERTDGLWTGGHAVDIRGTALEVVERMGLDAEVRDARTQLLRLSAIRPDGRRTYDVALRPMHEMRGDREIEIMRDDLVRILYSAVGDVWSPRCPTPMTSISTR